MRQRWTYRIYPTKDQEDHLSQVFGCCRVVWNKVLDYRQRSYQVGVRINYAQSDKYLTALKREKEYQWLNDISCVPLQQTVRDLQTAYTNFFAKRTKYPRFKKKNDRQSARYVGGAFKYTDGNRLELSKVGVLRIKWDRPLPAQPSSVTIIKEPTGKFFVSFVVEVSVNPLQKTKDSVGVDFGVLRLATLSNGETIANPKYLARYQKKLAWTQKLFARKQRGSRRKEKARIRVARVHAKIADSRKDALHKFSHSLVKRFDTIFVEDLNLRGMVKNHALARSLSDTSIGMAIRMIEAKCRMYGKRLVKIDRFFPSSKTCNSCGFLLQELPLDVRGWQCHSCKKAHDRDANAAKNILAVGQTVIARGGGVRAVRASARKASRLRSENHPASAGTPRL